MTMCKHRNWFGILAYEGRETLDSRMIDPGAVQFEAEEYPLPIVEVLPNQLSRAVGSIDAAWRDGPRIVGRGRWFEPGDGAEQVSVGVDLFTPRHGPGGAYLKDNVWHVARAALKGAHVTNNPSWLGIFLNIEPRENGDR